MSISELDIVNMALGLLGVDRISSLDEDDDCKNTYPMCRDACLEDIDWSFSIERFILAAPNVTGPAFGYANAFQLPSRVLRVLECNGNDPGSPWIVEQSLVLTDSESCQIRAVVRVTNPTKFSPSFCVALSMYLAATLAIPKTNSKTVADNWWSAYGALKRSAASNDGRQGTTPRITMRSSRKRYSL